MEIKVKEVQKHILGVNKLQNLVQIINNVWKWTPQFLAEQAMLHKTDKYREDYITILAQVNKISNLLQCMLNKINENELEIARLMAEIEELNKNGFAKIEGRGLPVKDEIKNRQQQIKLLTNYNSHILAFEPCKNTPNYEQDLLDIYNNLASGLENDEHYKLQTETGVSLAKTIANDLNRQVYDIYDISLYNADEKADVDTF